MAVKLGRNGEGYADFTAGIAIQKVLWEEKEAAMAKRRSCRHTTGENAIHEKAVKMRKMTDEQLVHYVEDRVAKARSEGFNEGKTFRQSGTFLSAKDFVEEIGRIRGIGDATMGKIRALLDKRLEALGKLTVGDRVVMNGKYHVPDKYKGKVFTVKREPEETGGLMCVWLEEYIGYYAVDGLTKEGAGDA